jgi:hypothetical protein
MMAFACSAEYGRLDGSRGIPTSLHTETRSEPTAKSARTAAESNHSFHRSRSIPHQCQKRAANAAVLAGGEQSRL